VNNAVRHTAPHAVSCVGGARWSALNAYRRIRVGEGRQQRKLYYDDSFGRRVHCAIPCVRACGWLGATAPVPGALVL